MDKFFEKYQIGCWYYRVTSRVTHEYIPYDIPTTMRDLGFTFVSLPEHHFEEGLVFLDKYVDRCEEEGMPALLCDKYIWAKKLDMYGEEIMRKRIKFYRERYKDKKCIKLIHVCDEPNWRGGLTHESDNCGIVVDALKELAPDWIPLIATLGIEYSKVKSYDMVADFVKRAKPAFLLPNVYSPFVADENDKYQCFNQLFQCLNVYHKISKDFNLPLWWSPMASNCWYFREPTQIDYRWQLNILAAHGVTGFMWYLIHASHHAKAMNPIDSFGQRSPKFYMLSYEIRAFKEKIAKKLEGYELEKVYHFARQYGEYPAMEEGVDDIIKNVSSFYFKAMVISKFKAKDGSGKYRIMITNNEIGTHNHYNIQFNEPYSKYNRSEYLEDGTAEIIDLFDPEVDDEEGLTDWITTLGKEVDKSKNALSSEEWAQSLNEATNNGELIK